MDTEGRVSIDAYKVNLFYTDGGGRLYRLDPDDVHVQQNIVDMGRLKREVLRAHLSANLDLVNEIIHPPMDDQ